LRSGGYVIDFWGLGYEIAERMGISDRTQPSLTMREMRIADNEGRRLTGFGTIGDAASAPR
jgi:hypothetical protein